ncbi:MAG: hypothetical protein ACXV5L_04530 [Thermoanaerobaculia bacterium]
MLKVANAALRFKPPTTTTAATTTTTKGGAPAPSAAAADATRTRTGSGGGRGNSGTLYYVDAKGNLASIKVHTGINDGTTTEISGDGVTEGMKVIAGTTTQTAQTSTAATPFGGSTSTQQQRGPRGGV